MKHRRSQSGPESPDEGAATPGLIQAQAAQEKAHPVGFRREKVAQRRPASRQSGQGPQREGVEQSGGDTQRRGGGEEEPLTQVDSPLFFSFLQDWLHVQTHSNRDTQLHRAGSPT